MRSSTIIAALGSLLSTAYCSSSSADYLVARGFDGLDDLVDDDAIVKAFTDAGHHDALFPMQTWENNEGEIYQTLYEFDADEWRSMRSSLFEKAGLNETDFSTLVARQDEDTPVFFCYNRNTKPIAYTVSLGAAANAVCSGFAFGAERLNRVQAIQRNIQGINGGVLRATFTYTYHITKWGLVSGCSIAMGVGINEACEFLETGIDGEQPASAGFRGEPDDEVEAGISLTRI